MATRFFQQPAFSQRNEVTLDASFRQDGFVRAVALAIVDRLVSRTFDNGALAKVVLEEFNKNFPQSVTKAAHANAVETLELMTSTPQKASRTAIELTWLLRQLMVDTMRQAPVNYLSVFYQQGDVVKPSELRAQGSDIDKAGLSALSKILNMTIVIHETENDKQLPAKTTYGQGNTVIYIDEHNGRFTPRVEHKEAFRPLNSILPVDLKSGPNIFQDENVSNQVDALLHRVSQANVENIQWLENMLEGGDITYDDLLNLYITHANDLGWQREFVKESTDLHTLLVNVAAAMISFGMTTRDELFEEAEEHAPISSPTA